jgi:hypothetical protein
MRVPKVKKKASANDGSEQLLSDEDIAKDLSSFTQGSASDSTIGLPGGIAQGLALMYVLITTL